MLPDQAQPRLPVDGFGDDLDVAVVLGELARPGTDGFLVAAGQVNALWDLIARLLAVSAAHLRTRV